LKGRSKRTAAIWDLRGLSAGPFAPQQRRCGDARPRRCGSLRQAPWARRARFSPVTSTCSPKSLCHKA